MRIRVAEDDAVSSRALQVTLQKWGYDVLVAGDGKQAWQVLRGEQAPELAVVDWMMPGMEGLEVCRRARKPYRAGCRGTAAGVGKAEWQRRPWTRRRGLRGA